MQRENKDWKRYVIAFLITAFLFLTAFYLSNYFNNKKIDQIRSIENSISIDILSSETQFNLLQEFSCGNVDDSILSEELNDLASKIEYGEENSIASKEELLSLRKYYSLLQIKDYLLMKEAEDKCHLKITSIIYFYSNNECVDCEKQGYILTDIRQKYPNVRVYSFDYNLDLSAIDALKRIYKLPDENGLPALVINGKTYKGLHTIDDIRDIVPGVFVLSDEDASTTSSTTSSTKATKSK
jgi:hypothetical protein